VYIYTTSQANFSTAQLGVGNLRIVPWKVEREFTLAELGADISTAGEAGALYRIGLYGDAGTGYPGGLLVDAGTVAADTTGVKMAAFTPITITPGLYWVGGVVQNVVTTQPTIRTVASWEPPIRLRMTSVPASGASAVGHSMTNVTGALPSSIPASQGLAGAAPRILGKTG
jgi:hypothetical protein